MVNNSLGNVKIYDAINEAGANVAVLISQDSYFTFSPTLHFSFKAGNRADTNSPAQAAAQVSPELIVSDGHQTICASIDRGDNGYAVATIDTCR